MKLSKTEIEQCLKAAERVLNPKSIDGDGRACYALESEGGKALRKKFANFYNRNSYNTWSGLEDNSMFVQGAERRKLCNLRADLIFLFVEACK